jgi:hypothetical protein
MLYCDTRRNHFDLEQHGRRDCIAAIADALVLSHEQQVLLAQMVGFPRG